MEEVIWSKKIPFKAYGDRRNADRLSIEIKVICELNTEELVCNSKDISISGLRIKVPKLIPVGSIMKMKIISPFSGRGIQLFAQVVWCREFEHEIFAGLNCIKASLEDMVGLSELVGELLVAFLLVVDEDT